MAKKIRTEQQLRYDIERRNNTYAKCLAEVEAALIESLRAVRNAEKVMLLIRHETMKKTRQRRMISQ